MKLLHLMERPAGKCCGASRSLCLKPFTAVNVVIASLGAFSVFDLIYVMTQGGPFKSTNVAMMEVYLQAFQFNQFGYAAALSVLVLLLIAGLSLGLLRIFRSGPGTLGLCHMSYSNPKARNCVRYLLLACFAVVILYPFALMIFGSLKTETAFLANPVSPPATIDLGNYQFAWNEAHIPKFALEQPDCGRRHGLFDVGQRVAWPRFALSLIRFRGRAWMYLAFVLPPHHSGSDLYHPSLCNDCPGSSFRFSGRVSSCPYTAGSLPLAIFLLKTYFDQLPSELMDAARLDGCSNRMIFLKVVLPLSRPVLSTVTIFTFVQSWNEFFLALVFIHNPDLQTLPLGLQAFFVNQYETQFPQLFATLALSIAPVVLVYLFLQKQFIAGLTAGAVKA